MPKVGDRVIIEGAKIGQQRREGSLVGITGRLLSVRWNDGSTSLLTPGAGSVTFLPKGGGKQIGSKPAGSKPTARRAAAPGSAAKKAAAKPAKARTAAKAGAGGAAAAKKPTTAKKPAAAAKKARRKKK